MPEIISKSQELRQAQLGAFLATRDDDLYHRDRKNIQGNFSDIAAGDLIDIERMPRDDIDMTKRQKFAGYVLKMLGKEKPAVTAKEYVDFLRSVGGSDYEPIQYRKEKLERFNQEFSQPVTQLLEEIHDLPEGSQHPDFMGKGSKSDTYRITHDGTDYAVRVVKRDNAFSNDYLTAAQLSDGMSHLEQIVAASLVHGRGVTVSEIMPGKELRKTAIEDMEAITDEQLSEMVDTIIAMEDRGIWPDLEHTNVFYDQEAGFGFIDQRVKRKSHLGTLGGDIRELTYALSSMNMGSEVRSASISLDILKRLRNIVESKLKEQDRETALEAIDDSIKRYQNGY